MIVSPLSDVATETLQLLVKQAVGHVKAKLTDATYSLAFIQEASNDAEQQAAMGRAIVLLERAQAVLDDA